MFINNNYIINNSLKIICNYTLNNISKLFNKLSIK